MDCAALSESKTVYVERESGGAFLYDADARCVVTMPTFPARQRTWGFRRELFPVAGDDDDTVYVMDMEPGGYTPVDEEDRFKFRALVHRDRRWQLEELPRLPYPYVVDDTASRYAKQIVSGAMMTGGGSEVVICVSTNGCGTYFFDTASRAWSKAGDCALPFTGKVEHDRELGIWLGFQHRRVEGQDSYHLCVCASSDLFTDVDGDCRDMAPPSSGWYYELASPLGKVVSLC